MKKILTLLPIIALLILCSCSKEGFFNGPTQDYYFLTTEVPSGIHKPEEMTVSCNAQIVELKVKAIAGSTPLPSKFQTITRPYNPETQESGEPNSKYEGDFVEIGPFYTIYSESENGEPVIVINIEANDTDSSRSFVLTAIGADLGSWIAVGFIQITQEAATSNPQP